jgi:transposase-like protein
MKATTKHQANTAADVNSHIGTFAQEVGIGILYVKAFLASNGSQVVQIDSVSVIYDD